MPALPLVALLAYTIFAIFAIFAMASASLEDAATAFAARSGRPCHTPDFVLIFLLSPCLASEFRDFESRLILPL
jgi:hypothetical protein